MNNRWIYGLELIVCAWISVRGGWIAVRGLSPIGRILGALALASAAATTLVLGLFILNRPIRPLLHATAFIGVGLVFLWEARRAAQTVPGWTAPFVGLYATLGLIVARPRHHGEPAGSDEAEGTEP